MDKDLKIRHLSKTWMSFALIIMLLIICIPPATNSNIYAYTSETHVASIDQEIHRGQTFDVDIDISSNTGILTLYLTIKYDHDVFKLINVQQLRTALGELNMEHSGSGYDYIDEKTGGFNLFWDGSKADSTNGTIVKLTFQSSLQAPLGTYPIDIVVDDKNTTSAYNVPTPVSATSPQITLIEGAYIVVWHDWNGIPIENTNITGHPYNELTGGYEYNSEESLNTKTDFPNNPTREEDAMYSYEFAYWEGAVWHGDVPNDSSVIYYIAKYNNTPKTYAVWYYVDGYGLDNDADGIIDEETELVTAIATDYGAIIDDRFTPYEPDSTFYGWYADSSFTTKLSTPLMPANDIKLYGYMKYNIRETDVPVIQLVYRETAANEEMENIAYVDVYITKNYGLSSLMITLTEYDKENFTFCGFEKGEIFKQMSFYTTNYENDVYPDNFNFSWNNSYVNSYELGHLLVLKFKVNKNAEPGAYKVEMKGDNQNTTYMSNSEIWYSEIEFINTTIPVGQTNYWVVPIEDVESLIEVESTRFVPYNIELVVRVATESVDTIINGASLEAVTSQNMSVQRVFEIYFQQNSTRLTLEQYTYLFGRENVIVKIKLTAFQLSSKNLNIYYVDDNGEMHLYESSIENGYLVFQTNHFSYWALISDNTAMNVETSSIKMLRISLILFGISASALISIAFVRNRKKQSLVIYRNIEKGGKE